MRCKNLAVASLCFSAACASATAPSSAVFCQRSNGDYNVFAGEILKNGDLSFGLSKWQFDGQNFGVFGIAKRTDAHWVYMANEGTSACRVVIDWRGRNGVRVAVDPKASCDANAGYGFRVKSADFEASNYKSPVTDELKDSESFFNSDPCS